LSYTPSILSLVLLTFNNENVVGPQVSSDGRGLSSIFRADAFARVCKSLEGSLWLVPDISNDHVTSWESISPRSVDPFDCRVSFRDVSNVEAQNSVCRWLIATIECSAPERPFPIIESSFAFSFAFEFLVQCVIEIWFGFNLPQLEGSHICCLD